MEGVCCQVSEAINRDLGAVGWIGGTIGAARDSVWPRWVMPPHLGDEKRHFGGTNEGSVV